MFAIHYIIYGTEMWTDHLYTHTDPHASSGTLTGKTWCFSQITLNSVAILGIAHSEALKQFMTLLLLRCKLNFTISECVSYECHNLYKCISQLPMGQANSHNMVLDLAEREDPHQ
ncbi:nuclear pore complex protein Nup214 [Platysternon megacephalum]|uniref:Nuclear pore complex protein Nup214 n=1 Tax=Platysternon megacephalum TaxID=55544 RepID=A0A4D9EB80_9SAUR|nr:nuclear pore complex protein Nup214 [Platysternon megacephalum]